MLLVVLVTIPIAQEFSNNTTLVVEIWIGLIIAIVVYLGTKENERRNKETLNEMNKKLEELYLENQRKQTSMKEDMKKTLLKIQELARTIITLSDQWKIETILDKKKEIVAHVHFKEEQLSNLAEQKLDVKDILSQFFTQNKIQGLEVISHRCKESIKFDEYNKTCDLSNIDSLIKGIDGEVKDL